MPQRQNCRGGVEVFSAKEAVMTMHTTDPKHSAFYRSSTGQMVISVVVLVAIILLAARYVF